MDEERYEFTRIIGKGRTGGVYEATDHELQRKVAIRRFFCAKGDSTIRGWENEFHALTQNLCDIHHPSILAVLEAGIDEDGAFMIYQLIEGKTLAHHIDKAPLKEKDVYEMAEQLLDALQISHDSGFVHGALSTSSISLIERPRGGYRAMLTDLGLSRLAPLIQGIDSAYARMADPVIMPPEMFDDKPATRRSDLYMIGHLIYTSLIGGHPFADQELAELSRSHCQGALPPITDYRDDLCPKFVEWISRLTESNASKRFSGASEALHQLPALTPASERQANTIAAPVLVAPKLHNAVIHTATVSPISVYIPQKKKNTKLIVGLSSVAALLIVAVVAVFASGNEEPPAQPSVAQVASEPKVEEAATIPVVHRANQVLYSKPHGEGIARSHLSITNRTSHDWVVYQGDSIEEEASYHPEGDIIKQAQALGDFTHLEYPLHRVQFNQRGSKDFKVPALHANSKESALDPGEGWSIELHTPTDSKESSIKIYTHFTTWSCDAILHIKDRNGEHIGEPRHYTSEHLNTSFGVLEHIKNLPAGEMIYLELIASEPKSDQGIGLSLSGLKVRLAD